MLNVQLWYDMTEIRWDCMLCKWDSNAMVWDFNTIAMVFCIRYAVQPFKFKVLVCADTIKNILIINIPFIWIHECKFNALH